MLLLNKKLNYSAKMLMFWKVTDDYIIFRKKSFFVYVINIRKKLLLFLPPENLYLQLLAIKLKSDSVISFYLIPLKP